MTIKGYYPSASLGFEILIGFINILGGLALLIFSLYVMLGSVAKLQDLLLIGAFSIPGALLAVSSGVLALSGSCRESPGSLRASYIVAVITLLVVLGISGWAFILTSNVGDSSRRAWFSLSDEDKKAVESAYACCGFSSTSEGSEGCESAVICRTPVVADLGAKFKVLAIIAAVVGTIQLAAILCGCCVWGTMRSQQAKAMSKQGLSLEAQAHHNRVREASKKSRGKKSKSSSHH